MIQTSGSLTAHGDRASEVYLNHHQREAPTLDGQVVRTVLGI